MRIEICITRWPSERKLKDSNKLGVKMPDAEEDPVPPEEPPEIPQEQVDPFSRPEDELTGWDKVVGHGV